MEYTVSNKAGLVSNPGQIYLSLLDNGGTVPVTIGYFSSERLGATVNFTWQTATETAIAGFNLLSEIEDTKEQINAQLIPSKVIDSIETTEYTYSVETDGSVFYIQEVSLNGNTDEVGPFELGQSYGVYIDLTTTTKVFLPILSK